MSDKDKGFGSMDKDRVREIASKGGQASHRNTDKGNDKSTNSSKSLHKASHTSHNK